MDGTKLAIGGSTGSVGGLLAVYIGQRLHWHLTPDDGAVIVAVASAAAAFIAHNGLVGIARMVWRGQKTPPAPPVS